MWSPNELLKTEKQRDILSYITLQFFPFKKVPLEHYPLGLRLFFGWNRGECLLRCLGERYAVSFRAGVPGMRGWFL